ncbi:Stk1 family PASTA domain-containing Ser/Thr kinase [Eubacterium sp. MSJ-33]|uniref:Stk1 family PASTA domain-containing Ser/Thr kinase n=1 Tax=Eubacterium sp. MSJ-33 TaxID=2841528 RepID=UPI001C751276|nr:Stk1 family PASTA domain-containing Ser/Thr kinase [Eubacterium sp. MSJ-33]QWT53186.1 Stk1 family PASTA domain-containing Ser/Thr kinase [Eubacterium sp. MSJ-33]
MLKPGMILCDRYEILDVVGAGGMSIVYKARDHRLNRNVAIKVLKPEFSNDKNFVTKFRIEAQASAGLTHPNIVNVYDVVDDEGIYCIVMELVEGITLKQYIEQNGRLNMETAIDFSIQIASGLEAAHENHIIHRDIKPQNIIVSKNGNIKVTDFGIAKAASSNTLTSGAMGSVHYISPEQARGGYSDERSDIYSLGITMYEMVTGRVPFEGDNNVSVALMHIQNEMIPPRQYYPDIYSSFEKIILKATQKKPERRYLTASALIADLKRVQNNPNIDIVVAPTSITNSPTQEWTKEDVQAIRNGSANRDMYSQPYDNPPVSQEMGEIRPIGYNSTPQANSGRINELLQEDEDEWEDEYEPEPQPKRGSLKKVQDYDEDEDIEDDEDPDDIDPGIRKAVTIAGVATAVIIAIIIIVVLGNVLGWFKFGSKKDNKNKITSEEVQSVAMLSVTGISEEAALKMLTDAGFTNVKTEHVEDEKTQEGYVFEQSVKEGEMIPVDQEIMLKVSAGAEEIDVPDVKGYEDSQAVTLLTEAGFQVSHAYEYSEDVEKDKVIKTDPEGGTKAAKGSKIIVTVSNGSEKKEVEVPNLGGLTEAQARDSLSSKKLSAGSVTHANSDSVAAGMVISQNPSRGTTVTEGDSVDFVISDGPEEKQKTYKASISGTITCNDPALDGSAVTVQVIFNGGAVYEQTITVNSGGSYNVSANVPNLSSQSGSASFVILAGGTDVTSSFTVPSPTVSFSEE